MAAHTDPIFKEQKLLKSNVKISTCFSQVFLSFHLRILHSLQNSITFFQRTTKHAIIIQGHARRAQSFRLPLCRTSTMRFSVYFQGPKSYNSLNANITKSFSYATLNKSLKNFFSVGMDLKLPSA